MRTLGRAVIWIGLSLLGAVAYSVIAFRRGEPLNAAWMIVAALCTYAIGIRFYSKWIAAKALVLDDLRAPPAEVHEDGRDYVKTNYWVLFGHHFASISGPGPLVGPVLAAQFGYLPGTLWILIGALLGGAVQDYVILFASVRRDGRSLAEMMRDEVSSLAGTIALVAILAILVILVASLGMVVTNALAESPWGLVTTAATMPFAMLMGLYLRYLRVGKVLEVTGIGVVLLAVALLAGYAVNHHPWLGPMFTLKKETLAISLIVYGFMASVLPVWLLLAPRDYLVTFLKLGVVSLLAIGIVSVLPTLKMPAFTSPESFTGGMRPVVAGSLFPFCFITIACGAISGFHSLVSSGTTPKMITRERHIRTIGYGAMCVESFVAIMAMIAACLLEPGLYFAINAPAGIVGSTPEAVAATVSSWGFPIHAGDLVAMANAIGEQTILSRTGGAPTLAIGMARIFGNILGGEAAMKIWYHFALMFEALFILTTVDVATRIGRFLIQELAGRFWKPAGNTTSYPANVGASLAFAVSWGYFLYVSVRDPLGGVNSLWPLFGIANQLLACVALCLAATILIKAGRARYSFVALLPLAWLSLVTFTAGLTKVFHGHPRVGFLAMADKLSNDLLAGVVPAERIALTKSLILNNRLDAVVALVFLSLIVAVMVVSAREWFLVLSGRKPGVLHEEPPHWLSKTVIESEQRRHSLGVGSTVLIVGTLAKELSGEAAAARTQKNPSDAYAETLARKYDNPKAPSRCC